MIPFEHVSVLPEETIEGLAVKENGIYIDGTVGGGGHSKRIAGRLNAKKGAKLICFDQDGEALSAAKQTLKEFEGLTTFINTNFVNMSRELEKLGISGADGILLDIGVSSYHLDNAERGFSYLVKSPLDMRMDTRNPLTAYIVVNEYKKEELARIIREYGEDRFANNIASHIVKHRETAPIEDTQELKRIVEEAIPMKIRKNEKNPAKRTFQAIRIEVNDELKVLTETLDEAVDILNPGGRLAVITFHSLEDRIVKKRFKEFEDPCICPPDFPVCRCGRISKGRVITRHPITASEKELQKNSRAKSAKLRIFEKSAPQPGKQT